MLSFFLTVIRCPSFPSSCSRFLVLAEDRPHLPDGGVAVVLAIDDHDRPEGAASQAGHGLQGELAVLCGLACRDVKLALELLPDLRAAPDVAGRAQADQARM